MVDLKTTNKGNCRLRTNAFPGEEKFDQGGMQYNISQELLQYLKQQNLVTPPVLPAMQQLRNNLDGLLTRKDLGENEKARKYVQLQNDFLTFQHQLNSRNQEPEAEGKKVTYQPPFKTQRLISQPNPVQAQAAVPVTLFHAPAAIQGIPISAPSVVPPATPLKASPPLTPSGILTPSPTVKMLLPSKQKRKLPPFQFRNYLDDDAPKRRSRRQPFKYSKDESD